LKGSASQWKKQYGDLIAEANAKVAAACGKQMFSSFVDAEVDFISLLIAT